MQTNIMACARSKYIHIGLYFEDFVVNSCFLSYAIWKSNKANLGLSQDQESILMIINIQESYLSKSLIIVYALWEK